MFIKVSERGGRKAEYMYLSLLSGTTLLEVEYWKWNMIISPNKRMWRKTLPPT